MEQGGNVSPRGRDVSGMDNRKIDDVMSLSSVGPTMSRDRHVAERMYAYYWSLSDVTRAEYDTGLYIVLQTSLAIPVLYSVEFRVEYFSGLPWNMTFSFRIFRT